MESYEQYKQRVSKLDLVIDRIYPNYPQPRANRSYTDMLGTARGGAIRYVNKSNADKYEGCGRYAYVVLSTTFDINEWPDRIIRQTGDVFFYGDNRDNKKDINDRLGNKILVDIFECTHRDEDRQLIPPILLFETKNKAAEKDQETGYSRFLGLLVPGTANSGFNDLVQEWRINNDGDRFPNYRARFTILNVNTVSREWLRKRVEDPEHSDEDAPKEWKDYIERGKNGINPLRAETGRNPVDKKLQLPGENTPDARMLQAIVSHYNSDSDGNSYGFEVLAAKLVTMFDSNFDNLKITSRSRDGGYDAFGEYKIGPKNHRVPIILNCLIEAKCYARTNSVGVKEVSRLLSRMKLGDIGVFVTTSFVLDHAYRETILDDRKILFITGQDIIDILRVNGVNETNLKGWLDELDATDKR